MLYRSLMIAGLAATSAFMAPAMHSKVQMSKVSMGGKGFGGGEATRDPEATVIDPNDPKGKQQAIHKAESFADYLAKRQGTDFEAKTCVLNCFHIDLDRRSTHQKISRIDTHFDDQALSVFCVQLF